MAVIKSGAGTAQWTIDQTSGAGRVTLYDTAGAVATFTLNASTSALAQETGNIATLVQNDQQSIIWLLGSMLTELRIQNDLLANGLNINYETFEVGRQDPYYLKTDVRHAS